MRAPSTLARLAVLAAVLCASGGATAQGSAADADGDAIADAADACPRTPGARHRRVPGCAGCPRRACLRPSGEIRLLGRVRFAFDDSVILPRSEPVLDDVLALLRTDTTIRRVRVEVHVDARGSDAHNLALTQARAAAVRDWLIARGVDPGRLEAWGCGATRSARNRTPRDPRRDRRVELYVVDPNPDAPPPTLDGCVQVR